MPSEKGPNSGPKELISHGTSMNIATHTTAPGDVCEWDYEVKIVKSIGEFPSRLHPARGSVFAIARIRIMNKGKVPISTSEGSWELTADGQKHPVRTGVRDKNIYYVETEVVEGQDVTTELVFEIPSKIQDIQIAYVGPGGYTLERNPSLLHPVGKSMICPNCGRQMEAGYLGMEKIFSDIAWFQERTVLGLGGESLGLKDKMGMVYADANRCKYCGFVMIKY
jgi:Domain of unknown function (DUF4352)/Domain of unknown function (DUF6487)